MHFLTKLDWYSTLFPRIPVPIEKQIEQHLLARKATRMMAARSLGGPDRGSRASSYVEGRQEERIPQRENNSPDNDRYDRSRYRDERPEINGRPDIPRRPSPERRRPSPRPSPERRRPSPRPVERERRRSRSADRHSKSTSRRTTPDRDRHSKRRSVERERRRSRSPVHRHSHHSDRKRDRSDERRKDRHQQRRSSRSRSRDRHGSRRDRSGSRGDRRSKERRTSPPAEGGRSSPKSIPRSDDPFERDLQKELDRVKKSKAGGDGRENGM